MRKDGPFRRPLAWLEPKAPRLHEFLTTHEKPKPALREALGGFLVIVLLVTILWGATGQPLNRSPVVVVESGSMMHCDQGLHSSTPSQLCDGPFGRLGTIDPGDLIFVRDVDDAGDVRGAAGCQADGGKERHGGCGDTIIFRPTGSKQLTPVIHRAMFWLDLHGNGVFSVPECGLERVDRTALMADGCILAVFESGSARSSLGNVLQRFESHPYDDYGPERSGFITMGDNNNGIDQGSEVNLGQPDPVRPEWILGKARGELPWLGLLKLGVSDITSNCDNDPRRQCNFANAPGDLKAMMWISLGIIILGPIAFERVMKARRQAD